MAKEANLTLLLTKKETTAFQKHKITGQMDLTENKIIFTNIKTQWIID